MPGISKFGSLHLILLALFIGCSPSASSPTGTAVGNVSGTVTLAGKPLSQGTVLLERSDHGVALVAAIGPDGSFTAKPYSGNGLPVGQYRLAVSSSPPGAYGGPPPSLNPNDKVPVRYRSLNTSNLTIDVIEGANPPVTIELNP